MTELPITICRIRTPDGDKDYVTCLSQVRVFERGLPAQAIVGVLLRPLNKGESITPAIFARNRVFVEFMQGVIERRAPGFLDLIHEAKRQGNGWVYIIDQRTQTPKGKIPPEDIVGAFEVKNEQIMPGSYRSNPKHLILSVDGFFRLSSELHLCLLEELDSLAESSTAVDKMNV